MPRRGPVRSRRRCTTRRCRPRGCRCVRARGASPGARGQARSPATARRPRPPGSRPARGRRRCHRRSVRPRRGRRAHLGPGIGARCPCGRTRAGPSFAGSSRPRPRTGSGRARSIRRGRDRPGSRRPRGLRRARTGTNARRRRAAVDPRRHRRIGCQSSGQCWWRTRRRGWGWPTGSIPEEVAQLAFEATGRK